MCECQARASTGSAVPASKDPDLIPTFVCWGCVGVTFCGKKNPRLLFFPSLAYYLGGFGGAELNYSVGFVGPLGDCPAQGELMAFCKQLMQFLLENICGG